MNESSYNKRFPFMITMRSENKKADTKRDQKETFGLFACPSLFVCGLLLVEWDTSRATELEIQF